MSIIGYVTVEEADTYIESRYVTTNVDRVRWEALEDSDRGVYLLQSVEAIDVLPFHGKKYLEEVQVLSFPRVVGYDYLYLASTPTIPDVVKYAQIENALSLSCEIDNSQYNEMRLQGVQSYSIGNLSESLRDMGSSNITYDGIASIKALKLLKPYLLGGYTI